MSNENEAQPPEGWQWVPKEPTAKMTHIGQSVRYDSSWSIGAIYREMLAAAPQPEAAAPVAVAWTDEMKNAFVNALPTYSRDEVDHPGDTGRTKYSALDEGDTFDKCLAAALAAAPAQQPVAASLTDAAMRKAFEDRHFGYMFPSDGDEAAFLNEFSAGWFAAVRLLSTNTAGSKDATQAVPSILDECLSPNNDPIRCYRVRCNLGKKCAALAQGEKK